MRVIVHSLLSVLVAVSLAGCASHQLAGAPSDGGMSRSLPGIHNRLRATDSITLPLTDAETASLSRSVRMYEDTHEFFGEDMAPSVVALWYPRTHREPYYDCVVFVRHSLDRKRRAYAVFSPDGTMRAFGHGEADPSFGKKPWEAW